MNQIFQREALVDDLTKLKNRKALRNEFYKYIGKSIYAVMADVDHFKSYNDTYGHVAGDKILCMVASATMQAFQGGDAYRYGGDAFLIVLPDCTDEAFIERIGEWRKALRSIEIPNVTLPVTCSFGYERRLLSNIENLELP